jgi:hypothetical protein
MSACIVCLCQISSAFVGVDGGGGGTEVVRVGEEEKAIWWRIIVNESYLWLGFPALPRRYAQFSLVHITFGCFSSVCILRASFCSYKMVVDCYITGYQNDLIRFHDRKAYLIKPSQDELASSLVRFVLR